MPLALAWPHGIELVLLAVFMLTGSLGVALALAARDLPLCFATAAHALAGALSILAGDLITLLVAWELLTFSAFVIIRQGKDAARPAYWYLAAQISAAALFFIAIAVHVGGGGSHAVGRLADVAQPFMVLAVLIKTAMMPLHGWLIGSYTRAGVLGSFVLSAYATKVGVYTAARTVAFSCASVPLVSIIGAVVAVAAVLFALAQHSARRLLSYHIISQVGYMLVGVGLAGTGAAASGVTAGLFHAANHIIYKALLFLVVAVIADHLGHDDLRRMGGLAPSMPVVFVCGVIGALAITGLPFTSGYASKELLKKAGGELQSVLLTIASVGTGLSFTKFIYLIFLRPARADRLHPDSRLSSTGDVSPTRLRVSPVASAALVTLAALSILVGVFPRFVPGVPAHEFYARQAVVAGLWPGAVAVLLWFIVGGRLVSATAGNNRDPVVRRALLSAAHPVMQRLRRAHRLNAQLALGITVAGAVVLALVLAAL